MQALPSGADGRSFARRGAEAAIHLPVLFAVLQVFSLPAITFNGIYIDTGRVTVTTDAALIDITSIIATV